MRTYKLMIGDRELVLATTFKANSMITAQVMDPLLIARDAAMQDQANKLGREYKPAFSMSVGNLVKIVHCGHKAAGGELSVDDIGDLMMDAGPANMIEPISEYLACLVAGSPVELPKGKTKGAAAAKN